MFTSTDTRRGSILGVKPQPFGLDRVFAVLDRSRTIRRELAGRECWHRTCRVDTKCTGSRRGLMLRSATNHAKIACTLRMLVSRVPGPSAQPPGLR